MPWAFWVPLTFFSLKDKCPFGKFVKNRVTILSIRP